ncbi:MAG: FeoB-associated Cys-rich membrane protein [Oscillospiraceae bacterium]|nr:FeoB-associated Cys-rich membrane protein [Oscillospiraceae bacterium]MBR2806433.1 FeoB-associated Cys-rich membrane protein [Oscillospiraceae bacterium]
MGNWFADNLGSIIALAVVIVIVLITIRSIKKSKQSGGCSCGCSSCTGKCPHCITPVKK